MRLLFITIFILFSLNQINAQSFELKNNIEIIVKSDGEQCLVHTVELKQTLYNISRLYNTPLKEILAYNNLSSSDIIHKGNKIYIPLNHRIFSKHIKPSNPAYHLKPIVYTTRPKDSFYAITHRYFNIDEEDLIKNNKLKTKSLMIGQGLTIGWIALKDNYSDWSNDKTSKIDIESEKSVPKSKKSIASNKKEQNSDKVSSPKSDPTDVYNNMEEIETINTLPLKNRKSFDLNQRKDIAIDKSIEIVDKTKNNDVLKPDKEYITQTGIAMWNKQGSDKENSFVLHPTAKINSVIELFNPLTQRTTYAKVIAHIPPNTYSSDISILISPKVAERLGALDDRFQIKMTYYK